jgi:hypothetical protein
MELFNSRRLPTREAVLSHLKHRLQRGKVKKKVSGERVIEKQVKMAWIMF